MLKNPTLVIIKERRNSNFHAYPVRRTISLGTVLILRMSRNMWNRVRILHQLCSPILSPPNTNKWLLKFPHNILPIQVWQFHLQLVLHPSTFWWRILLTSSCEWNLMINNQRENHPLMWTLHRYHNPMDHSLLRNQHSMLYHTLQKGHCVHSFPSQRKALLTSNGAINSTDANLLFFDPDNNEQPLPHTITLQILVSCVGKNVHRTVLDEGAATYIMSYSCW